MRSQNKIRLFIITLLLLTNIGISYAQNAQTKSIDEYAERILKDFEVPGMAVAVVKDGKVVFAKGYGVRKLGDSTPVTADTLFGIASNSKAFTSAALAILVDEEKIKWDDPVTMHLPSFQLYDPYVTREITIRDLLTHRAGLPFGGGDLLFFPSSTYTRDDIVHKVRYIKPASSFRSKYAYDNLLYLVAGQIIPAATGKSWDEFVKERIFNPLGMTRSNTSVKDFRTGDNIASPHAPADGKLLVIEYLNLDNTAPAGSINSSVSEMAKWVITQLNRGAFPNGEGKEIRLFSERQHKEMWTPQTIMPTGNPIPGLEPMSSLFLSYGLGWGISEYRGHRMIAHSGGLPGMLSRVALIPDANLGVIVLTNQESGAAFRSMTYHLIDSYLNTFDRDWGKAFLALSSKQKQAADDDMKSIAAKRNTSSKPSLPVSKYNGTYRDAWYGDISISEENGKQIMRFTRTAALTGVMEHWHYDTFIVRWNDRTLNADAFVTFSLNHEGAIEQAKMRAVSSTTDFSYDFHDLLLIPVDSKKK